MYVGGRESLGRTEDLSEIGSNYLDANAVCGGCCILV